MQIVQIWARHLLCFYTHHYTRTHRCPNTCCQESCADTVKPEKRFKQPPVMLLITVNLLCTTLHKAWRTSSILSPSALVTSAYTHIHSTYPSPYSTIATFVHSSFKFRITKLFVENPFSRGWFILTACSGDISYFHHVGAVIPSICINKEPWSVKPHWIYIYIYIYICMCVCTYMKSWCKSL